MPTHPLASFARAHRRHTTRTHTGILNKMTAVMKRLIALASLAVILAVSVQADTVTEVLDAAQVGGNDTDSLPQPAAYKPAKHEHHKHHTSSWGDDDDGGAGLALNVGGGTLINPTTGGVLALNVGGGTLINPTTGGVLTRVGPNTAIDPTNGQVHIIANPDM